MKVSIITTTINMPTLLADYAKDASNSKHDVDFIISGDKKTPLEIKDFCLDLEKQYGLKVDYMDIDDQDAFMKEFPELDKFIPWNCIQRRNLPIMKAYMNDSEVIITIDDDNYLAQDQYVDGHGDLGAKSSFLAIQSPTGWLNICDYLNDINGREFFARGYPWQERIKKVEAISEETKEGKIVVNGGFWLGDPDIDAVTRLAAPIDVVSYKKEENFALDIGTWAPFNSQNTALHRSVIPAYFLVPNIGRFDDIWASYIVKRAADHMGDYISFGYPLVKQDRNEHDLWLDAAQERLGTQLTDKFCACLKELELNSDNYLELGKEIIQGLEAKLDSLNLNEEQYSFIKQFTNGYKLWFEAVEQMDGALKN
jgi:hypothetical protein